LTARAAIAALALLLASAAVASPTGISTVGRDVVVNERVPGRVVAVAADVRIESAVAGDVIVWGGDVSFGPAGSTAVFPAARCPSRARWRRPALSSRSTLPR
jgi:hypothetical protein